MRHRLAIAYAVVIAACGSRTALIGDELDESSKNDASTFGPDSSTDASRDAEIRLDGAPDVFTNDCPDASVTFIYLVSDSRELYSYNPLDGIFRDIGTVNCPSSLPNGGGAFSMAVDRQGTAYVLMWNQQGQDPSTAEIFRVDTANASCTAIPEYLADPDFRVFGMGFATNGGGPSETLFLEGAAYFGTHPGLRSLDTTTFKQAVLGNNNPPIQGGELTGTGDGRLFEFFFFQNFGEFNLGEVDKTNGQLLSQAPVGGGIGGNTGFSFAYWGGDFYFFTAPSGSTIATRYRPSDQSYETAATLSGVSIVGAGVSTCAPQ